MKKADLAQGIGLVANLGVVAGIVLLAIEIQQNSSQIEESAVAAAAQAVFQLEQEANSIVLTLAQDESLAELVYRGYDNRDSLSGIEQRRFDNFVTAIFNIYEAAWLYQRKGLIDDADFAGWRASLCTKLAREGARDSWDSGKGSYIEGFVEDVSVWCPERLELTP